MSRSQPATLREKIGQMLLIGFRGLEADEHSPIARDIRAGRIGGVVLFDRDLALETADRNIRSPQQLKTLVESLQSRADTPLLIAIDQEGGHVARLKEKAGFPATVSAQALGRMDNTELTLECSERTAVAMAACGINLNFAPLVDLNVNPQNPIIGKYERSFGADADLVVRHALAVIEGHRRHRVACCLKHFPGHGSSRQDSHLGFTDVSDTWHESELLPYRELIAGGQAEAIMTAHIFNSQLDSEFPATLSKKTIYQLLRREMHYTGIVISDDMEMKAISAEYSREKVLELALNAGIDVVLMANNMVYDPDIASRTQETILGLIAAKRVSAARIERACRRVQAWKRSWLAMAEK
ncbi:MAG: glycoside hydrolase family 3 protein [Candidatus Aminicenantes bacterium]|nr:glycoside hydrolase family 3 protein [Candidatus Aminicenantes bacterium]